MYSVKSFSYNDMPVSTLADKAGAVLFDATHICAVLGYSRKAGNILEKLDDDEKVLLDRENFEVTDSVTSSGGAQQKYFLTEPGLYRLIFQSRKEEAKAFTRWVTHEVLPAIRRTGQYRAKTGQAVPDMGKVARILTNAKKAAKEMGVCEFRAREIGAEKVRDQLGVDVYELLGIERGRQITPKTERDDLFDRLIEEIRGRLGDQPFTVRLVVRLAQEEGGKFGALIEEIAGKGGSLYRALGFFLRRRRDNRLHRLGKTMYGMRWRLNEFEAEAEKN